MDWDKLPPRHIEECRHRVVDGLETADGSAVCKLLTEAGIPHEHCRVQRAACSACLGMFPPAPNCWNLVVASLIYVRSRRALTSVSLTPQERIRLTELTDRAAGHLVSAETLAAQVGATQDGACPAESLRTVLPPRKPRGRRVRSWAVGVVSSPRRQPTLDATLDSLIRAGWDNPHLFLDGTVRVPSRFAGLPGVLREPRIGCWPNYYLALAELLMRRPDADAYLLAQDDALFYAGEAVREYMEQMLWPDQRRCLVSLYCPSCYTARESGWHSCGSRWALGALAFIFPRRLAQEFLLDPVVCNHRWARWQEAHGGLANVDVVIGHWAMCKRIAIWYPTPSLVQHIGATSTLTFHLEATGARRADRWIQ